MASQRIFFVLLFLCLYLLCDAGRGKGRRGWGTKRRPWKPHLDQNTLQRFLNKPRGGNNNNNNNNNNNDDDDNNNNNIPGTNNKRRPFPEPSPEPQGLPRWPNDVANPWDKTGWRGGKSHPSHDGDRDRWPGSEDRSKDRPDSDESRDRDGDRDRPTPGGFPWGEKKGGKSKPDDEGDSSEEDERHRHGRHHHHRRHRHKHIIIGCVVGGVAVIAAVVVICCCCHRRRRHPRDRTLSKEKLQFSGDGGSTLSMDQISTKSSLPPSYSELEGFEPPPLYAEPKDKESESKKPVVMDPSLLESYLTPRAETNSLSIYDNIDENAKKDKDKQAV